ncbi:hypothetical protein GUJ93_ZPchr0008g13096 [Zizania palustris]|uniref:Uncharacterized protein n=1 Tax=Zizania palustris TaxID=103762 RepID=A0A8J5RSJ4_ZIZPA|nr:hypothetical protein GUJ93_ZPchr0008g13096 [Zizania palustris]
MPIILNQIRVQSDRLREREREREKACTCGVVGSNNYWNTALLCLLSFRDTAGLKPPPPLLRLLPPRPGGALCGPRRPPEGRFLPFLTRGLLLRGTILRWGEQL